MIQKIFIKEDWLQKPCQLYERHTGKSLSEALIFASTNPQYDNRLFIDLRVQYMKIPSSEHGENILRTCCLHVLPLFSPCSELGIFMY